MTASGKPAPHPLFKLATELGPLVIFFAANAKFGLFVATAAFMVAIVAAIVASYVVTRHVPLMALEPAPVPAPVPRRRHRAGSLAAAEVTAARHQAQALLAGLEQLPPSEMLEPLLLRARALVKRLEA